MLRKMDVTICTGFRQTGSGKESCRAVVSPGRTLAHFPFCGPRDGSSHQSQFLSLLYFLFWCLFWSKVSNCSLSSGGRSLLL